MSIKQPWPSVEEILHTFEQLSLDNTGFYRFTNNENLEVLLHYQRQEKEPWSIWFSLSESDSKQKCTRKHLLTVLSAFGIDQEQLTSALRDHLLTQAAFADQFLTQVTQLFGVDAIENSVMGMRDFIRELSSAVQDALDPKKTSASNGTAEGAQVLRIVKTNKTKGDKKD